MIDGNTHTKLRLFIALPLPREVRDMLGVTSSRLGENLPSGAVRWVSPERMHLTIRFLGDQPANIVAPISRVMDSMTAPLAPFSLYLTSLGCFPNSRRPRVIWAGLNGAVDEVQDLKARLDHGLAELGIPEDNRSFRPHITIGRVKNRGQLDALNLRHALSPLNFEALNLELIQSVLKPDGPLYSTRHTSQVGMARVN